MLDETYDQPYTPEIIRKILDVLPDLMACRDSGMLQLNLRNAPRKSLDDKVTVEIVQGLAPRPSRRSNTVYQIDNVGAIVVDLQRALANALTDFQRELILCRFSRGYTLMEIAKAINISVGTVKYHTRIAIEEMAAYLEQPRKPSPFKRYEGDPYQHTRKYSNATRIQAA